MAFTVTDSWRSFERVLPHLPAFIHAFALTQRGHGDSDRPVTGYRTRDFAADAAAFADALGLGPAMVVGHSMGSTNALRFAIGYPERTLGLVLAGTIASYSRTGRVLGVCDIRADRSDRPCLRPRVAISGILSS